MGALDMLTKAAGPAGAIAGGIFNAIGSFGQLKQAKKNQAQSASFNNGQLAETRSLYDNLLSSAKNQETYKGDTSLYKNATAEAQKQQLEASGTVNPVDSLAREDARLTTANYINAANRGAKSGTDLMSIAGQAANQESRAMRDINLQNAQVSVNAKQSANNNYLSSLTTLAGATAKERGLEFQSGLDKSNMVLNLTKEGGMTVLDRAYQNQQQAMAMSGAVADARASIYSGIGDVFRSVGGGITQAQNQNEMMSMYSNFYGSQGGGISNQGSSGLLQQAKSLPQMPNPFLNNTNVTNYTNFPTYINSKGEALKN